MTTENSSTEALHRDYFSAHSDACILDLAAWLRAKYADRFAAFPDYAKIVNDSNHGRDLIWAFTTHEFEAEVKGFIAGWGSRENNRTKDMLAELMREVEEERQSRAWFDAERLSQQVDLIDDRHDDDEPDIDDSVKACPECETPNQFGEICDRCRREIDTEEGQFDLEVD